MTTHPELSIEERICQLLLHLKIQRAHFAASQPSDWTTLAAKHPQIFASLTLIGRVPVDPKTLEHLSSRLLVVYGDRGPDAPRVQPVLARLPEAELVSVANYALNGSWNDIVGDRTDAVGNALKRFLARMNAPGTAEVEAPDGESGEVAGITYRIRGSGPPLVLLPLGLARSQWEPLIPMLRRRFATITLGGEHLGMVALLESRGHGSGYLRMFRSLVEETRIRPGNAILEVGCGSGVLVRWLARHTAGNNPITGVDVNRYLLNEAEVLARRDGVGSAIDFREGNAESLPFPDESFEVVLSVTVIEELDADRLIAEMIRVTRPGGRVGVIARSLDLPLVVNLPLDPELKTKVENVRTGSAEETGCADASLYRRFQRAGLTEVGMFPQWASFDASDRFVLQMLQDGILSMLNPEEVQQWRKARAKAEADATFFISWPHHCAVGTKSWIFSPIRHS